MPNWAIRISADGTRTRVLVSQKKGTAIEVETEDGKKSRVYYNDGMGYPYVERPDGKPKPKRKPCWFMDYSGKHKSKTVPIVSKFFPSRDG